MNMPTRYPPQKGVWTLIAPDGRKWEGSSGLDVAAKEQRERIPASVALERIYRAMDDESPRMETRKAPACSYCEDEPGYCKICGGITCPIVGCKIKGKHEHTIVGPEMNREVEDRK